jgi:hypothetical protein
MKSTTHIFLLTAALAGAMGLAGCATPETRIRTHPEIVAQIAPPQLDLIKKGRVAPGFDMEMVRLALGEPDRVDMRAITGTTTGDCNEIWTYANYESAEGRPLYRGLYHRFYVAGNPLYPFYLNYPARRERERFRVVFKGDKVIATEKDGTVAKLN